MGLLMMLVCDWLHVFCCIYGVVLGAHVLQRFYGCCS